MAGSYNYPVQELEASLRRAFVDNKADYIFLNDRRQQFLFESAAYGQEQGWLSDIEEVGSWESQYTEWRFRLTKKGREHFGLKKRAA